MMALSPLLPNKVLKEYLEYQINFIERPHPVFNSLPICPYARWARTNDKIFYNVIPFPAEDIIKELEWFSKQTKYELYLAIDPNGTAAIDEHKNYVENLNQNIDPLGLLAFFGHPADNFNIQGVLTRKEPFITFQVLKRVASDKYTSKLKRTKYYQNWTKEHFDYINYMTP